RRGRLNCPAGTVASQRLRSTELVDVLGRPAFGPGVAVDHRSELMVELGALRRGEFSGEVVQLDGVGLEVVELALAGAVSDVQELPSAHRFVARRVAGDVVLDVG